VFLTVSTGFVTPVSIEKRDKLSGTNEGKYSETTSSPTDDTKFDESSGRCTRPIVLITDA